MSDHNIVLTEITTKPMKIKRKPHKIHLYKSMNLDGLRHDLQTASEEFLASDPSSRTVDENWTIFKQHIATAMEAHIPSKMSKASPQLPWLSRDLKRMMRKREALYRKATKEKDLAAKKKYKTYRNLVTSRLKEAHHKYMCEVIGNSLQSNPKKFWSHVKFSRTENISIPTLRHNDRICAKDVDKAEALNNQFGSVFTDDNGIIPNKDMSHYPDILPFSISAEGVQKRLADISPNKACGPDEIPARVLRDAAAEIAPMLATIFQQTLDTGSIPKDWTNALVSAIYKKGKKDDPANYRPVSLTCICCKICEHIVSSQINRHLSSNNILTSQQHGFREKLSCETQLVEVMHDWSSTLDNTGQVDVILLDFSKAFDKVSHPKLLYKLQYYGIRGQTLSWIKAFLSNRTQEVSVNGTHSSSIQVTSGVPQGSVLGPTLFLIFINDIVEKVSSKMRLFADDSAIYREIHSPEDHHILQDDLHTLNKWSEDWQMDFNVKKCVLLPITRKRKPSVFQYKMKGEELSRITSHDYLGVTVSNDLRPAQHIAKITGKASSTLGIVRRTLKSCTPEVKEKAYHALVRPKLEFATSSWNPHTDRDVKTLEQVQREAARFVTGQYKPKTSVTKLIRDLGWDSLELRRLMSSCTMFHKIHHQLVNIGFPPCFTPSTRGSPHKFVPLPSNTNTLRYSFFVRIIPVWNLLPASLVSVPTAQAFQLVALPVVRAIRPPAYLKRY